MNPNANSRRKVSEYGLQLKEKQKLTMEDMITRRAPVFANSNPDMTIQEAFDLLHELLPKLERWKTIG